MGRASVGRVHRSLAEQVGVITSAGSGIGRGVAQRFAGYGAAVACVDRDGDAAAETSLLIERAGGRSGAWKADASSSIDVNRTADEIRAAFGRIDVLVNTAGGATLGSVLELSDNAWNECLTNNLTATFFWSRAVLQTMESAGGVIVNLCSSLADVGGPRFAAYTAAKAGVRGLTKQMARDYGPNVRVNSVSPAAIDTPGLRAAFEAAPDPSALEREVTEANKLMGRLGTVDEVVDAIVFAATDESSFMTGHDLVLCGGQAVVAY